MLSKVDMLPPLTIIDTKTALTIKWDQSSVDPN